MANIVNAKALLPAIRRLEENKDPVTFFVFANSNGTYPNQLSGSLNYGRVGGLAQALFSAGYRMKAVGPIMPGAGPAAPSVPGGRAFSTVANNNPALPWDVTVLPAYGGESGAPAGADIFWNFDANGLTPGFGVPEYSTLLPFRYRYQSAAGTPGTNISGTIGRVWPGAITLRTGVCPLLGDDLLGRYWYVRGPWPDSAGHFTPTFRQTTDRVIGSLVSCAEANPGVSGWEVASTTLAIGKGAYSSGANLDVNWGTTSGTNTVRGSLVTLALQVETTDNPGGFQIVPMYTNAGAVCLNASQAVLNMTDEGWSWFIEAAVANQTDPMIVIDWPWGINDYATLTHAQVTSSTVSAMNRLKAIWAAKGFKPENLIIMCGNDQPINPAETVASAFVLGVFDDMRAAQVQLGDSALVYDRNSILPYSGYIANGWQADASNHHLAYPTGYNGDMTLLWSTLVEEAKRGRVFGRRRSVGLRRTDNLTRL